MKTIWKYPIKVTDYQTIEIPKYSEIIDVQVQDETPCVWVLVNPENGNMIKGLRIFGTGHEIDPEEDFYYVGTFQLHEGVCHLFEIGID